RAAASQARIPSPQAKRPRTLTTWHAIGVPSPPVPPSPDTTPSASSRDWANLSDGPAGLISERLLAADVADYVSFRAACRPWRLCSTDPREHGVLDRRFHPRQWTMLRTKRGSPYRRCFMNVSTGCCRYVHLPELRGHDVFGPTTEGLLVLLDRATCVVRLLNPFTRQAADLPPATALMTQRDLERRRDGGDLAEISGTFLADDCTIAVCFAGITTLAVAKPGDAQWAVVDRGTYLSPAMSFAGRFYCATNRVVMVVETSADDHPPRLAVAAELSRPKLVPVRGLGGRAVFIGWERALSVSPSVFPSISADTIYLGFNSLFGYMDDSPVHLMEVTSEPPFLGSEAYVQLLR
uniref:KIB1-4 beta-propeller domain-containing protein n=1 Tax=Setaria italica TaxID=4555 RepID=K4A348_SETIT